MVAATKAAGATKAPARSRRVPVAPHPLAHLIPSKTKADLYISRTVEGVQDIDLLRYAGASGKHVLLSGPTGLGKSHLVEAYAATDGLPLVVIEAKDGIDPNTFFGSYTPKSDGGFEWVNSDVVEVLLKGGVLFIDEVNFMRARVSATFHRVLREGQFAILERGNELHRCAVKPDGTPAVQIVAAYNDGYEGTYPLNQAFRNRFAIKVEVDYDPEVEEQLVYMPALREVAGKLRNPSSSVDSPVSTNMLVEFEELAADIGLDFAIANFVNAFEQDERESVRETLALHGQRLKDQLVEMLAVEDPT